MRKMLFVSMVLGALIAASAFAGCGLEKRQGKTITLTGDKLEILADEYLFDPETIYAKPGKVAIQFRNIGTLNHNLKFFRGEQLVARAPALEPKEVSSAQVDLRPGTYQLICTVGDHEDLGMDGKIIVK